MFLGRRFVYTLIVFKKLSFLGITKIILELPAFKFKIDTNFSLS